MSKFSIIIPVYNVGRYLTPCVESVLAQDFSDYEVIIVDDGSTDDSSEICDFYAKKDKRVNVIHKSNGGLVSARKAGVCASKGDYCIALDGDDWIANNTLSMLNEIIGKYHSDIVRFGLISSCSDGDQKAIPITFFREGYYSKHDIERELMPWLICGEDGHSFPHSICGSAIKRTLYLEEQTAVPDRIVIGEDASVMHPLYLKAESIFVTRGCYYYYRTNRKSLTKNRKPFDLRNAQWRAVHRAERIDLKKYDLLSQLDRSTVHTLFNACITQFWQKKSYCEIKSEIDNALNDKYYKEIVNRTEYPKSLVRSLMVFVLRQRMISVIWLLSKIKRF